MCLLAGGLSFTSEVALPVKRFAVIAADFFPLQLEIQPAVADLYILNFR